MDYKLKKDAYNAPKINEMELTSLSVMCQSSAGLTFSNPFSDLDSEEEW